jgi:TatD DNase family protein
MMSPGPVGKQRSFQKNADTTVSRFRAFCFWGIGKNSENKKLIGAASTTFTCVIFWPMPSWIDTHCHLDAIEFGDATALVRARAAANGVVHCVIPAVRPANFDAVRQLAHEGGDSYALGIHPLCVKDASESDLSLLRERLARDFGDPRLVAVGEIGLDFFVPELCANPLREKQEHFYRQQLNLAIEFNLPLILHVRRSADRLLKHLRDCAKTGHNWRGIAHAFNGSEVQAHEFIKLGIKLGFGGAVTFERALQLRRLAVNLPLDTILLETDSPDIPPKWLYNTVSTRQAGLMQSPNEPAQLPRIAAVVAALRGISPEALAAATRANAIAALPRLGALLPPA